MKSSKSNTKTSVATNIFEASSLRGFSRCLKLYKYMVCHKNLNKCAYQYYKEIFLDGKVDNLVYITLVKLVSAQLGICCFEVIQRVKFL